MQLRYATTRCTFSTRRPMQGRCVPWDCTSYPRWPRRLPIRDCALGSLSDGVPRPTHFISPTLRWQSPYRISAVCGAWLLSGSLWRASSMEISSPCARICWGYRTLLCRKRRREAQRHRSPQVSSAWPSWDPPSRSIQLLVVVPLRYVNFILFIYTKFNFSSK